jgi:adenosylhomocysteine nucleosidase
LALLPGGRETVNGRRRYAASDSLSYHTSVSDLTFDDPCIVFALRREAASFLREFRTQQRFPGSPCWARFCGPAWLTVLALETGVGAAATERALDWALQGPVIGTVPYRPKVVLSAGFAGALQPELRVGDVVLATEVADGEGNLWATTWPSDLPPGEWRPPLHRGRLLTAPAMIGSVEHKQELGRRHAAAAVDMESAAIARLCKRSGVPFGCVRAISDDPATPLSPRLAALLSRGRVSPVRLLAAIAGSPGITGELWRLAGATRFAAEQLGKALGELLTLTLPWGKDL